nr:cysteine-rich receptor-like protein kinase [Tanacetum cinerariifolium]
MKVVVAPVVLAIRGGKIQKNNKNKKPQAAKGNSRGKDKITYPPKSKIPPPPKKEHPAKDVICHHYGEVVIGGGIGLRGSRKLKAVALNMYVGNENCATVEAIVFFLHCEFPKGGVSSFIALIPKNQNAHLVKDFRPISLIGSLYKIIAKILANRLVGVLSDIVNEVQSAFISDRQILDGPFILNEVVQWCKSKKKQALIFKVDFEKAYDSVRWDFLDEILKKFWFGDKWCKWIMSCLRSSRGSIIVNGSPTEEFQFGKGLKQGDPLSPFLFILVMESLHLSFQRIVDAGVETSRHLFFSCVMARDVVNLITRWWNVPDSVFDSYEGWMAWLADVRLPKKNKKMLEGFFYVTWWMLWWFRNKTIFEVKVPKKAMFFDDLVSVQKKV